MVCLTLQSTILSLNKAGKLYKSQSSLTNPVSEEEESHTEKESDNDLVLFSENPFSFPPSFTFITFTWPQTTTRCLTHVFEIPVPPPEFS